MGVETNKRDYTWKQMGKVKRSATIGQVSRDYDISRTTLYRWIRAGNVGSFKIGGWRHIDLDSLDSYLARDVPEE